MNDDIVCTICPTSCLVQAEWNDTELLNISRQQCKLAWDYIESEIFDPRRVVTTTLPVEGGRFPLVSVRSESGVPKDMVMDVMDELANVVAHPPIRVGDVLVPNVLDTGINIVATRHVD